MAYYERCVHECDVCNVHREIVLRYDDVGIPHFGACKECSPQLWVDAENLEKPEYRAEVVKGHLARAEQWDRVVEELSAVFDKAMQSGPAAEHNGHKFRYEMNHVLEAARSQALRERGAAEQLA